MKNFQITVWGSVPGLWRSRVSKHEEKSFSASIKNISRLLPTSIQKCGFVTLILDICLLERSIPNSQQPQVRGNFYKWQQYRVEWSLLRHLSFWFNFHFSFSTPASGSAAEFTLYLRHRRAQAALQTQHVINLCLMISCEKYKHLLAEKTSAPELKDRWTHAMFC